MWKHLLIVTFSLWMSGCSVLPYAVGPGTHLVALKLQEDERERQRKKQEEMIREFHAEEDAREEARREREEAQRREMEERAEARRRELNERDEAHRQWQDERERELRPYQEVIEKYGQDADFVQKALSVMNCIDGEEVSQRIEAIREEKAFAERTGGFVDVQRISFHQERIRFVESWMAVKVQIMELYEREALECSSRAVLDIRSCLQGDERACADPETGEAVRFHAAIEKMNWVEQFVQK